MVSGIALIGDVVASRSMASDARHDLQVRLDACFRDPRAVTGRGVLARPLITLGDEFQGLFTHDELGTEGLLDLLDAILDAARPARMRFGIGLGEVTTPLKPEAIGMDGPCFHRARAALEEAASSSSACRLRGPHAACRMWGLLASYAFEQRMGWSDAQHRAVKLHDELGSWAAVAEAEGVSRAAVSLRRKAAGQGRFMEARLTLEDGLRMILRGESE